MNIFVIGNGMFTTGRGTDNYGTILPAIIECQRNCDEVLNIFIIGSTVRGSKLAEKKYKSISLLSKIKLNINFFPKKNNNIHEYKNIINKNKFNSCAIIATPDHLHFKIAKFCIEKKIHVLVVKPLTPSLKQSKILVNLAKNNNIYGAVEFHKRFDKQNILAKNKINQNEFGKILYNIVEFSQRKSIPTKIFSKWINQTNLIQYLGVHYIDLMYFFTKAVPVKILSIGQKKFLNSKNINAYDSIQCIIKWKLKNNEFFDQIIFLNWIDPENSSAMSDQKYKIISTRGRIEIDQKNRGIESVTDFSNIQHPNPDFSYFFKDNDNKYYWSGYGIESINTFINDVMNIFAKKITIKQLEKTRPTFKSSLISTAVIEAGIKSLKKNSIWIAVKT